VADVRVKICGLTRREDALAADRAGADYLGVVVSSGFGRSVAPKDAAFVVSGTRAKKVAVVVDETATQAAAAAVALSADVIQLHGDEPVETIDELRQRGSWMLWKAVRARSLDEVERAVERYAGVVQGLLIEGWKQGSVGGSGSRVALEPSDVRALVPAQLDLILAGGLDPDNVADAVRSFRPDVVDVSSGVERKLREKDHERVRAFVDAARGAAVGASAAGRAR
jgi:phosphoribosylanthranilate isomerase